jgi:hypothetical protein
MQRRIAKATTWQKGQLEKTLQNHLAKSIKDWAFPIQFHQNQSHPALPETWGGSGLTRLGHQGVNCGGMGRFWSRHGFPDACQKIAWPKVT